MAALAKQAPALLLLTLGLGCGSSEGVGNADGGPSNDASRADGQGSSDGAGPNDASSPSDATSDDLVASDEGTIEDGGTLDGGGTLTAPVDLGTAADYVILSKSGISTVPTSAVTGNIGVSPAAATYITGFSLTADSTKVFSTSKQVTGKVYASNYAVPTPSNLTTAIGDMLTAFTAAAGRAPDTTELGAGDIGGMTLAPGVYKWTTGLDIPTDVTLKGGAKDVWIFQIAKKLIVSSATRVSLTGGAVSKNVFWQVAGSVDLGTTSHLEGVILTMTSVALQSGASINGRLLAQTAVTIADSTVVEPAH